MKKLLLFTLFCISINISAQSESVSKNALNLFNKYIIKIDTNVIYNSQVTGLFIKQICAANTADFDITKQYYVVTTKKNLEQTIISGKLQKNATPMAEFTFVGKVEASPIVQENPIGNE